METPSHTHPLIGSYHHWTDALSYRIDNNRSPVGLEQKIPVGSRILFFPQTAVPFKKLHPAISDSIFNSKFSPAHISAQMNVLNISASLWLFKTIEAERENILYIQRVQTYIERCVRVYLCFSASVPQSRNNKGNSFSWTDSGLFTVIQPGTREQKYPAHRLTIQTKQCFWMCLSPFIVLLMQPAASAVQSQPLHINIVSVCSTKPHKPASISSKGVLHSYLMLQPSTLLHLVKMQLGHLCTFKHNEAQLYAKSLRKEKNTNWFCTRN